MSVSRSLEIIKAAGEYSAETTSMLVEALEAGAITRDELVDVLGKLMVAAADCGALACWLGVTDEIRVNGEILTDERYMTSNCEDSSNAARCALMDAVLFNGTEGKKA